MPSTFETPYTSYPGGSLPAPETSPEEGRRELWAFVGLSVVNTAIIVVVGVAAWLAVR